MSTSFFSNFSSPFLPELQSRVVMAAMTRGFADGDHKATDTIRDYYARRAQNGAGLILTEGVIVHPHGDGYCNVPHIATDAQADSWRPVIEAVQTARGRIFCQLWHCGRISHSDFTGGLPPLSSTTKQASGINRQNNKPYGIPEALSKANIAVVVDQYVAAASRALAVGFDGVQIHMGHGYLVDQFLDSRINDRTDEYGGSIENRCRFALELLHKIICRCPAKKLIVRLSPSRDMGGIYDWPDLDAMLEHLIPQMWTLGLRNLDISCAHADYYQTSGRVIRKVRPMWKGLIMGGASLSLEQAQQEVDAGWLDLVTWGRLFIANPDLVRRFAAGQSLVPFDRATMLSHLV